MTVGAASPKSVSTPPASCSKSAYASTAERPKSTTALTARALATIFAILPTAPSSPLPIDAPAAVPTDSMPLPLSCERRFLVNPSAFGETLTYPLATSVPDGIQSPHFTKYGAHEFEVNVRTALTSRLALRWSLHGLWSVSVVLGIFRLRPPQQPQRVVD